MQIYSFMNVDLKTQGNLITNMLLFMNKCHIYLILGNSRIVAAYEESLTDSMCINTGVCQLFGLLFHKFPVVFH
ncbi:hypothetical protein T11_7945 [Trichinella zimbabwensis]|uniref:Uncharacterized protein n=1 Tax=Trichinella zimbabwensis TaxID=268475 RepID=A0A0V1GKS4_9BILA|nr:hypothetical protein T11_7945 [Trichinella zimbabwensis]